MISIFQITQSRLGLVAVLTFFGGPAFSLLATLTGQLAIEDMKEIIDMWVTYLGTPAGAVIGFYFAHRHPSASTPAS